MHSSIQVNSKKKKTSETDRKEGPFGKKRRCTDVIFLILIIASWLAMIGIGLTSTGFIQSDHLKAGQPYVLINGMDYLGNICGVTNFTNPPNNENILDKPKAYILPSGLNICIQSCPEEFDMSKFYCKYEVEAFIAEQTKTVHLEKGESIANGTKKSLYLYYTSIEECMPYMESTAYLGYCAPSAVTDTIAQTMKNEYSNHNITTNTHLTIVKDGITNGDFFDEAMSDVYLTRYVIFTFGIGGALILGFLFLTLLRVPGVLSIIVWSIIFAISGALTAGGYYMRQTSIRWESEGIKEAHQVKGMYWLSMTSYAVAITWCLIICATRRRIYLAIAVVREASAAISAMPILILYPAFPVIGFALFLIPWIVFMVYLASSGETITQCVCPNKDDYNTTINNMEVEDILNNSYSNEAFNNECDVGCYVYRSFQYAKNTQYAGMYLVFSMFWTTQFIIACMQLCVATSISMWYFTKEKKRVGNHTFFQAMFYATFYHLGTCAFGSLIVAIVKTVRVILTYVQKKISKIENTFAKAVLMSLQCCMCILEKCIKFVNKNAYIQTAIHGYSFCKGAREAFYLILRNVLRISAVSVVSEIVLLIGKLLIVVLSTISAYFYLDHYFEDQLRGLHVVTSLIFLISMVSAELFNQIFAIAISTILQCYVTDEETFEAEDMFAPGNLANVIDETQKSTSLSIIVHPNEKQSLTKKLLPSKQTGEQSKMA